MTPQQGKEGHQLHILRERAAVAAGSASPQKRLRISVLPGRSELLRRLLLLCLSAICKQRCLCCDRCTAHHAYEAAYAVRSTNAQSSDYNVVQPSAFRTLARATEPYSS